MNRAPLPILWLCLAAACHDDEAARATSGAETPTAPSVLIPAVGEEDEAPARPQQKGAATRADEHIAIAAGTLLAGSMPGDDGRYSSLEPALVSFDLGAFEIDKLPYPNDPTKPPVTNVTRARAAELCAERSGRLCSELEWERACKGLEAQRYAGGDVWDPLCAHTPQTCASSFGVLALGGAMREWTASDVLPIKELLKQGAAVRGAQADAAGVDHRCAHRNVVDPASNAGDLGFRCCYGDPPAAQIASPEWLATVRKAEMPPERLAELFQQNPRLAPLASDIKYFREESAVDTVLRRGRARADEADAGSPPARGEMTTAPILWNPAPGEEILLVTGQSNKDSFIVAFHRLPDDRYRVGAALIMKDELGPIVIAYQPLVRRKLEWATCWECRAEAGHITYRPENRVVITQE